MEGASPPPSQATKAQLEQMAMWPEVSIRGLLAGEDPAPPPSSSGDDQAPPSVDLLFVLQANNATFIENKEDGGIIGATLLLKGVHETIVSFADRPYRTMDAIPINEFFNYSLVNDFFAGDNPPNAIMAGELPADIAQHFVHRSGTSSTLPHRRLLGGVLGAATYNPEANELRFRLPAGVDVFDADGKTRILQPDVFDEIKQAYAEANAKNGVAPAPAAEEEDLDVLPVLQQISIFIDPFHAELDEPVTSGGSRKLLQRRGGGRGGGGHRGGGGRAGAVRVGGGGVARASTGRRGFNNGFGRPGWNGGNNFIRRGGRNVIIGGGGWGGRGIYGGGGYYGDYDPYLNSRALAYPQAVPVPVPVAVPTQQNVEPIPPAAAALSVQDVVAALNGVWRGDGGGTGMGQIVITMNDNGATASFSAAPTGCANCAQGCRWSTAQGTVQITGDVAVVEPIINMCLNGASSGTELARATLERATNGRNVLYWTPAKISTEWIRNV